MIDFKYSEILKLNKNFEKKLQSDAYKIAILSNVTIHQIKEILEYSLRIQLINAQVTIGNYDNIIQESNRFQDYHAAIIFWEAYNIIEGLHYKAEMINDNNLNDLIGKTKSEIDLVFRNFNKMPLVLINKFSTTMFSSLKLKKNKLDYLAEQLNNYIDKIIPDNCKVINLETIFSKISVDNCFDFRYFYSSKAPYTISFFKRYSEFIRPYFIHANGKSKKVIIFDCDNTLWKGVLGEEGPKNIEMSKMTKDGAIFEEVQSIALELYMNGVLICLCSKNNHDDVMELINFNKDMLLKEKHITVSKINWLDKATNIKSISEELNIGLDAIVFVDDSSFEINLIKNQLPEVKVIQVPGELYRYPQTLRKSFNLFYNPSLTEEDKNKTKMYKIEKKRKVAKHSFNSIEDYLKSLDLKMKIYEDDGSLVPRLSQMTQKTNQFNLTTQRYTENDINRFIQNPEVKVYSFSISDKYGDSGITGMGIINLDNINYSAMIDTFLMSCRVIGRNLEFKFLDYIVKKVKQKNFLKIEANYFKTPKNIQVNKFYENNSFSLKEEKGFQKKYFIETSSYKQKRNLNYIKIVNE